MTILDDGLRKFDLLRKQTAQLDASESGVQVRNDMILSEAHAEVRRADEVEPEPLRRPLPPAAAYPMGALGPLAAVAQRIRDVVQAPDAMCAQAVLAAASLAVQPLADVGIDGRRELLSLYALTIGESGERKSGVDRIALGAHRERERAWLSIYESHLQQHAVEMAAHDSAKKNIDKKTKDRVEMRRSLEDLGPPPPPPLTPILIVSTPTLEGLHRLYATGKPSLGLFHDDGGEFIGGHAMSAEHRVKSAAGMSKLWDVGEFDRVRASDRAAKYYGRRLAMHLMLQPVIAEEILSDEVLIGQGLLARALLAWPTSSIGHRPYVQVDLSHDPVIAAYYRQIDALLELDQKMHAGSRNELEPRALTLSPTARQAWIDAYDSIEQQQRDGGEWSNIRPWASKAPAQILRIAAVQTMYQDPGTAIIEEDAIKRAVVLMNYYLTEAVRIVGTSKIPTVIRHAELLLAWCHREGIEFLHSQAAMQYGPGCIRTKSLFDAAMQALESHGWAKIAGKRKIDGAMRQKVWQIVKVGK